MSDAARQPASAAPPERRIDATAVLMGVAFAAIWSSAFSSAKIALADAPPFLMLGLRFAAVGRSAAVAIAAALGQRLPRIAAGVDADRAVRALPEHALSRAEFPRDDDRAGGARGDHRQRPAADRGRDRLGAGRAPAGARIARAGVGFAGVC
jgi:hypothetical protein